MSAKKPIKKKPILCPVCGEKLKFGVPVVLKEIKSK
jgi:hypothetical protein